MIFREDQISIMAYSGGTMAVPAVPGAGKTFIIANLAADILLKQKHKPGKLLIVTYMLSAANNFKSRIGKLLEEKGFSNMSDYEVMTIHSLALRILKECPDAIGLHEDFDILDEGKRNIFLQQGFAYWLYQGGEDSLKSFLHTEKGFKQWKDGFHGVAGALISKLKLHDLSAGTFKKMAAEQREPLLTAVSNIYGIYDKALRSNGYIDYDDLLNFSYKVLKQDARIRERYQNRYTYIFEDECQDSNLLQGKLLSLLSEKNGNLIRVGDINQSITGTFSASNPVFFKEFCSQAQHCHTMDMANRSSTDIIGMANFLVQDVSQSHPEPSCRDALTAQYIRPVPAGPWGQNPKFNEYHLYSYIENSWDGEIYRAIRLLKGFKKKYPDKTAALLVPSNYHVESMASVLKKEGIEYDELSNTSEKRMRPVRTLGMVLDYLAQPESKDKFLQLLQQFMGGKEGKEAEKLWAWVGKHNPEQFLYQQRETEQEEKAVNQLISANLRQEFWKQIERIRRILDLPQTRIEDLILKAVDLLSFEKEEKAMAEAVAFFIRNRRAREPRLTYSEIADLLTHQGGKIFKTAAEVIYDLQEYEPNADRVTVCTYHKAKGLEWDCVMLLGLTQYNFPSSLVHKNRSEYWYLKEDYKNPTAVGNAQIDRLLGRESPQNPVIEAKEEVIREKIRLLYVGITRAKEFLILLAHQQYGEKGKSEEVSYYFQRLAEYIRLQRSKQL
ncbi:ATP-dependent helicase [Geosporobacter ferrireducens]|uniref:ATP-dependent helicase n=1 Tax=Geosporobacter ferrireducens TaxID=1424294 RepID=UPI00139B7667|nr:ATP-dependent helicase [Geosporobacter ferrireducens]MTI54508.1 ATP-dependent helicase [Geosporobacter ferrireducens]